MCKVSGSVPAPASGNMLWSFRTPKSAVAAIFARIVLLNVVVGDRVTVKAGVQLRGGLRVGDDVFIGPNVAFTNDRFPRSGQHLDQSIETIIRNGASIGAGAVILPGIVIGECAMVGAGATTPNFLN
jgi:acetyltransferase-like isoleucine patch superfamily enzyme